MRHIWQDEPLSMDTSIWRYFTQDRFLDALQSRTMYFASAQQFEDPFEGAVAVQAHDFPIDPRYAEPESTELAFQQLRRYTKISSWHVADYESDAMWKLYTGERKGIAVHSTIGRATAAFMPFRLEPTFGVEEPMQGMVRYVDLRESRLRAGLEDRFFHKHRAFESEREFRFAISLRMAAEYGVAVPTEGIRVPFSPHELIQEILLGPSLSQAERTTFMQRYESIGSIVAPRVSTLLGRPRYV